VQRVRALRWIIATILVAVAGLLGFILILPGEDVVRSRYATLATARSDRLFERGWLPDILPVSAHDILVVNNLDFNSSAGEFYFAAADDPGFAARLLPEDAGGPELQGVMSKFRKRGLRTGVFKESGVTWVFACRPQQGYCEYLLQNAIPAKPR
jgi:hypothetical protein